MTAYQIEQANERQALSALTRDIATALGNGWQYIAPKDDDELTSRNRYIVNGDRKVSVGFVWNQRDRVSLRGTFDNGLHQHLPYRAENPEITVAISRGPAVIAREIARRVLPAYDALLAQTKARKAEANEFRRKQVANLVALGAVVGLTLTPRDDVDRFFFDGGEVRVSDDDASVTLHGLTIEQARQILAFTR